MNLSKLFAVVWDLEKRTYSTAYLDDFLRESLDDFRAERAPVEQILAIVETHEAAVKFRLELEASLDRPPGNAPGGA